jgi:2-polyprenyl-6-methoxyphenol hydroxylase-like FAD-dependent oxidoreductase
MDTDVLVVGAGPTGLMLANQLVRRGVRVLIIDRHAGPSLQTRALGVQARTLEIYAKLGIVDRALELGKRGTGANLWAQGRKMARVPLGEAGQGVTPYPFIPDPRPGRQRSASWATSCASSARPCSGTPSSWA